MSLYLLEICFLQYMYLSMTPHYYLPPEPLFRFTAKLTTRYALNAIREYFVARLRV